MKNYEKNKDRDSKDIKRFSVSKDKVTLFLRIEGQDLILDRLTANIMLAKDVYRPLPYPLTFINYLSKTVQGMAKLR